MTTTIDFEGQLLPAVQGDSVAATLASHGIYDLRVCRSGELRGIFCGMGVCHECLVEIDGQPNQRACLTKVDRPMKIARQKFLAETNHATETIRDEHIQPPEIEMPQLLVIGGGIGGISAAAAAAESGLDVILLDDRVQLGGQFCKQPALHHKSLIQRKSDRQMKLGQDVIQRATNAGVKIVTDAQVWASFPEKDILTICGGQPRWFRPENLVVATGAYERGLPVPGWTLPGVMTTGAAQALLRTYRIIPGQRVLIAGNGPFNLQVALELSKAGAIVVGVAESASRPGLNSWRALYNMYRGSRRLLLDGMRYVFQLKLKKIPIWYKHQIVSIEKSGHGLRARLQSSAKNKGSSIDPLNIDVVCMGYGFLPSNMILRSLGCEHQFDEYRRQLVVKRSSNFETTVPNIYAVGDCAGLGGAYSAAEEGILTGIHIASTLHHAPSDKLAMEGAKSRLQLSKHKQFQSGLWKLFETSRVNTELATPETIICRCESVKLVDISDAIRAGCVSIGEVKQRTRAGMGRCQGRYCAPILAEFMSKETQTTLAEDGFFAPRAPVSPIEISKIAMFSQPD
ncbi:MAG: hypothetical protein CL398_06865 [Acidiferrobacteraceae bacterium]|nr:hypothetical protein [Acidiferrobacteraceae bacterium]